MAPLASMFLSTIINLPSEFLETIIGGIMNAYILACVSSLHMILIVRVCVSVCEIIGENSRNLLDLLVRYTCPRNRIYAQGGHCHHMMKRNQKQ